MRLAWMVAPTSTVAELAEIKANIDLGTPLLPQAALAEFISSGAMDRHLRRTRATYRRRRDALVSTVHARQPAVNVSGIAAGLHVVCLLSHDRHADNLRADASAVVTIARSLGFAAQPLSRYRHIPGPPGIVIGYAAMPVDQIIAAAPELADALVPATALRQGRI